MDHAAESHDPCTCCKKFRWTRNALIAIVALLALRGLTK